MNQNVLELLKLVQGTTRTESEQLQALAALADAPPENYQPKMKLPVQNELPAFKLGDGGLGSKLANLDYGVPGPVPGNEQKPQPTIGQMLIGETDG